jgi:hypothetical protein
MYGGIAMRRYAETGQNTSGRPAAQQKLIGFVIAPTAPEVVLPSGPARSPIEHQPAMSS